MDAHVNYPNTAELNWVSLSYHSPPKSVKWQSSSLNLFELLAVCRLGFISLCKWYRLNFAFLINWTELNLLYLNNLIQLRKGFAAWCMCICEKIHMKLYVCFFFYVYFFSFALQYLLLLNTEGEPWRNPSRGCNWIWAEVSGVFQASVKLTVQGQDYPDHWLRVLLPGTVTSHCVYLWCPFLMPPTCSILSRSLPGVHLNSPWPCKTPDKSQRRTAETLLWQWLSLGQNAERCLQKNT